MNEFFKVIQKPEYVHVLLNHLPLTGLFVALLFLLAAVIRNHRPSLMIALAAVGLLSLSVWPVAEFGERAYDRVLSMTNEAGGKYLKRHKELADRWVFVFYATSVAAAAALYIGWQKPRYLRLAVVVVAALAAASLVAGSVIADCGGKIRHREFRYGPPPQEVSRRTEGLSSDDSMSRGRGGNRISCRIEYGERITACCSIVSFSQEKHQEQHRHVTA